MHSLQLTNVRHSQTAAQNYNPQMHSHQVNFVLRSTYLCPKHFFSLRDQSEKACARQVNSSEKSILRSEFSK
jgi:hypothetical protein